MPMDYFVWVAVAPDRQAVVIDCGFTAQVPDIVKQTGVTRRETGPIA